MWKKAVLLIWASAACAAADPLRVAVLDFENLASTPDDAALVGGVRPDAIAAKGVHILGIVLANEDGFRLIDRRDFIGRVERVPAITTGDDAPARPSFLRAAQALNTDVVLRGMLMSFAPSRRTVTQGGHKADFVDMSLRVALQALDTRDGTIIAASDGAATWKTRQTDSLQTTIGEDELVNLLRSAVEDAMPALNGLLRKRVAEERARRKVRLSVRTSSDPALVELNGMLIGTTPLAGFEVYKGDHILTVGKAGYRDVNKRIMLDSDTEIEVPMLRIDLTADELKEVLETMRMNVVLGMPEPALVIQTFQAE